MRSRFEWLNRDRFPLINANRLFSYKKESAENCFFYHLRHPRITQMLRHVNALRYGAGDLYGKLKGLEKAGSQRAVVNALSKRIGDA